MTLTAGGVSLRGARVEVGECGGAHDPWLWFLALGRVPGRGSVKEGALAWSVEAWHTIPRRWRRQPRTASARSGLC